jgi:hypothetical protein
MAARTTVVEVMQRKRSFALRLELRVLEVDAAFIGWAPFTASWRGEG